MGVATVARKLAYDAVYTAGTYADTLLSIPILAADRLTKRERIDAMHERSETFQLRERLRGSLDTEPGTRFIANNVVAAIPYILAGMPAAEVADAFINRTFPDMPKVAQYVIDSLATLATQMGVGYSIFMLSEIRLNRQKYERDGALSPKLILRGLGRTVRAFLPFDVTYASAKVGGQTWQLFMGRNPWIASGLVDAVATPLWWSVAIPLGLHNRIIESKKTREWDLEAEVEDVARSDYS